MVLKKEELSKKLEEICSILESRYSENPQIGVLDGVSGISLFFFYYSKHLGVNTYSEVGTRVLQTAIDRVNHGYKYPTYCTGLAGVGWVMEHLFEKDLIEIDNDDLLPKLDEYLFDCMLRDFKNGNYDILHGALGYGIYFLKRFKNTKSRHLKSQYEGYLKRLLVDLEALSEKDKNGLKWRSIVNIETGTLGYNLSLSHGMSSIVNLLARLYQFDEFKEKSLPLLDGAIGYLLSKERQNQSLTLFPDIVSIPESPSGRSRLAWCYGDLGLGLSLLRASEVTENQQWASKALQILKHTTKRKTAEKCGVVDASPCHGAFGLSQVYLFLFQKTKVPEFEVAAEHWIDEGLKLSVHSDGYAGYKQYNGPDDWKSETGLLEGISGIGLIIISHLANFETHWDECLFIN